APRRRRTGAGHDGGATAPGAGARPRAGEGRGAGTVGQPVEQHTPREIWRVGGLAGWRVVRGARRGSPGRSLPDRVGGWSEELGASLRAGHCPTALASDPRNSAQAPRRSLPDRVGGGRAAGVRTHIRPVGFGRPFASRTERVQSGAQPSSRTRHARSVLVQVGRPACWYLSLTRST